MQDSVENLAEAELENTHCSPLIPPGSYFIVEGKHDFPLRNLCCLLLMAFLSSKWIEMASRMRHYISFLRIEVRLTFLNSGVAFAFFQSSGTFSDHHTLSDITPSMPVKVSISSLWAFSCNQHSHFPTPFSNGPHYIFCFPVVIGAIEESLLVFLVIFCPDLITDGIKFQITSKLLVLCISKPMFIKQNHRAG